MKHVRERMIEDMKLRGLAPRTQDRYLHAIKALTEHYRRPPAKITQEQVRKYHVFYIICKVYRVSIPTANCLVLVVMNNLAWNCQLQGRYAEVEQLLSNDKVDIGAQQITR